MKFADKNIFTDLSPYPRAGCEQDLKAINRFTKEWYERLCPFVTYKELSRVGDKDALDPNIIDEVWNEPLPDDTTGITQLKFSRIFKVRSYPVYPPDEITHKKYGLTIEKLTTFHFAYSILEEADFYPAVGDVIFYELKNFVVSRVQVLPENRFLNTGFPLHVSCGTQIMAYGDSFPVNAETGTKL